MRLVEFLILILEAHAETLRRLAALLGEDALVELLELGGELNEEEGREVTALKLNPLVLEKSLLPPAAPSGPAYQELEGAVREMNLPETLEFHLWAYPHYRAFIESRLDLNSRIPGYTGETGSHLVEEAVSQAQSWMRRLPLPPQISMQAERAAYVPWLRFRSTILKRIGKRPMGPVC